MYKIDRRGWVQKSFSRKIPAYITCFHHKSISWGLTVIVIKLMKGGGARAPFLKITFSALCNKTLCNAFLRKHRILFKSSSFSHIFNLKLDKIKLNQILENWIIKRYYTNKLLSTHNKNILYNIKYVLWKITNIICITERFCGFSLTYQ